RRVTDGIDARHAVINTSGGPFMSPMLIRRTAVPVAGNQPLLHIDQTLRRGRRGEMVRLAQEWLCLNECDVMIDGMFGYATEQAVKDFQGGTGVLPVTGEV